MKIIINESDNERLEYAAKELEKIDEFKNQFKPVESIEEFTQVKNISVALHDLSKELNEKRLENTKPLREEQERINGIFNPVIVRLETASKHFIESCRKYSQKMEDLRKAELKRIADEQTKAILSGSEIPEKQIAPEIPKVKTMKTWTFEIVDEAKIPRSFLKLNDSEVNAAIKSGVRHISGLKIYQKETVVR